MAITESSDFETNYKVKLEKFEGPLELLLHLIKKNELDIYDIPISIITNQYLQYIKLMKELNLEIAGEFLVMASTLLQIKSQMLLPILPSEDPVAEEEDPRAELIRRLLEYQKYKDAANMLENIDQTGRDLFSCSLVEPEFEISQDVEEIIEVELFELIEAFRSVLSRITKEKFHEIKTESICMADRINRILSLLQEKESIRFDEIFTADHTREDVIANFLAVLELCKRKMLKIIQWALFADIWITTAVREDQIDTVAKDGISYV
ncbi:MAG TPA: segregation/condensation protein A [Syntrophales bacterium]|nr:segregation/condensation protein A [Syntrophales bacterium]